jgi:serine-type D-Ala-D-Ala endopeptidase (penicillin-binding protein 7)
MKKIILILAILSLGVANVSYAKTKHHKKHATHAVKHTHNKHGKYSKRSKLQPPMYSQSRANILLVNMTDHHLLDGHYDSNKVSIASISKLMTIYTVLKAKQDPMEVLTVTEKSINHTRLSRGMELTRHDLIRLSLIHSDNMAALTLSQNYPGGEEAFVKQMNINAKDLQMFDTMFFESTGLNPYNSSTLHDISLLTSAVSTHEIFRDAAQSDSVTVHARKGKKVITIKAGPTSNMFGKEGVVTIKTGFTNAAGWCVTMLVNSDNKMYNLVILGAKSKNERKYLIEKSLKTIASV